MAVLIKDKDRMVQLSIMEGLIDGLSVYKLRPLNGTTRPTL